MTPADIRAEFDTVAWESPAGELAIELPEGTTTVRAGQGVILPGASSKHKASALTDTVTLFLVEDA